MPPVHDTVHLGKLYASLAHVRTSTASLSVHELDKLSVYLDQLQAEVRRQKYERGAASQVLLSSELVHKIMVQLLLSHGCYEVFAAASVSRLWRDTVADVMAALRLEPTPWTETACISLAQQANGAVVGVDEDDDASWWVLRPHGLDDDTDFRTFTQLNIEEGVLEEHGAPLYHHEFFDTSALSVVCDNRPGHNEVYIHSSSNVYLLKAILDDPPGITVESYCYVNEPAVDTEYPGEVAMACANGLLYVVDRFHAVQVFDCESMQLRSRFGTSYYVEQGEPELLRSERLLPSFEGRITDKVLDGAHQGGVAVSSDW